MGYIMPVTQYEYIHYKVRDVQNNEQIKQVDKSYKVILDSEKENLNNKYQPYKSHPKIKVKDNTEDVKEDPLPKRNYSEITGKGNLLSEEV